ncbi:ankyrin repeat protein [Colletotrichum kahawae]|uniref:Ankyrin repeat protein n=1 Tax=Colletotrichum kahawae TaxID=34407 RepID=A0AAD9YGU2_COLKA|nr:ankyrin repeat protein [Colletotrichum kahawae]
MEALAAVIGVVGPVCQAASKIFQIVSAVRNATDNIHRLRQRIELLHRALEDVQRACSLRQGRRLLPPERYHYKSISSILQGCQRSLFTLERQLLTVPSDPRLGSQIALAIEQRFSQDDVNQAVEDIKHYTTVLNLTLSSLLLVQNLEAQNSQAEILQEVQRFARQLRNTLTFPLQVPYTTDQTFVLVGGREVRDPTLALDVRQWSNTATRLAEGVLIEGDQNHNDFRRGSIKNTAAFPVSEASVPRSISTRFNQPLEMHKYEWNIKISKLLKEGELYYNASLYLQTAMEIRKLLVESGTARLGDDNNDMVEELADLYGLFATTDGNYKARELLEALSSSCENHSSMEESRISRLHHKLGVLCHRSLDLPAACAHLETALQIRLNESPRDTAKIIDTCRELRDARYEAGDHAEYHATRDYVEQEIGSFEDLPRNKLERALQWARDNGFPDVHLDNM